MDFGITSNYTFLIVALGTILLSISAGAIGCISVMKGQSLIGDAIGHASFPGIVIAFMLFSTRNPAILLLGAITSGAICFLFIQLIHKNSKIDLDASLAISLSSFFGLGMALKSYIQGNPIFSKANQSGLQNYIFGQSAYIMKEDIILILLISIPSLILLVVFYKEIKLFIFDEIYAKTIGINTKFMYFIMLIITMGIISIGLKIVGSILIASFLIIPCISAIQWSSRFSIVLVVSSFVGGLSSLIGTYISTSYNGMSTGPTIIVVMSCIAFISLIFGHHGIVHNIKMRRKYK